MIVLFPSNATVFNNNGLGSLSGCTKCIVTEELNGSFELTMEYPITETLFNDISLRSIILAKTNPHGSYQPFRVYNISRPINKVITVSAAHISYDLSDIPVLAYTAKNVTEAFTKLKSNSIISNPFTFYSYVDDPGEINVDAPKSARNVLGNNIQKAYPGEYEFDGYAVYHHKKRGFDRGFKIKYSKNLLDIEQTDEITNVYTGVYPFWSGEKVDEEGKVVEKIYISLPEKIVKTPGEFNFEKIMTLNAGDHFSDVPTVEKLREYAVDYIDKNKLGTPDTSITASFVQLSKSVDYYDFTGDETITLGDTVTVDYYDMGILAESRCVKTIYDAKLDVYESISLGKTKSSLSSNISDSNKDFNETIKDQEKKFDAIIGSIKIGIADIDQALIDKADINYLNANFAKIVNGYIDSAVIKEASITSAKIEDAAITNAKIGKLAVDTANIQNAAITNAKISDLSADKITAGDITTDRMTANAINAVNATIGSATIDSAKIGNLNADKITAGDISADRMTANAIKAVNATIGTATINSAKIGDLNADKITAGDISADRMTANAIKAVNATIGNATISAAKIGDLSADKITSGTISADRIGAGTIDAGKINADTISAIEISASELTASKISSGEIKVGDANIIDGTISGAKITKATITNAQISTAFIADAYVKDLKADVITGGTLNAKNITVTHLSADSITVGKINGNQIATNTITSDNLDDLLNNTITNVVKDVSDALTDIGIIQGALTDIDEDISNATNTANSALTSANGKNKIYYGSGAPSVSKPVTGDMWFDTAANNKMYQYDGSKWTTRLIGTNAISDAAITNAKISSLDAGKITAGTIAADRIGANSITTAKIAANAVTGDKITGNTITGGHIKASTIQTSNLDAGIITTVKLAAEAITSEKINTEELFVNDNAFISKLKAVDIDASNITTGVISNERIDIKGLISFESLNDDLSKVFEVINNKTFINGGMISTNSIKANSIDLLSGLVVRDTTGRPTFSVSSTGLVDIDATLQSTIFDEAKSVGYRITSDGTAIFNQARLNGTFMMPNAGITNHGDFVGNENFAINSRSGSLTSFSNGTNYCGMSVRIMIPSGSKVGDYVNVSYTFKYENLVRSGTNGGLRHQGSGNVTGWSSGSFGGISLTSLIQWGKSGTLEISHRFQLTADHLNNEWWDTNFRTDYITSGKISFTDMKLERGSVKTPWCPYKTEQNDDVRMWAGESYEKRNDAPFKVTQSGKLFATDAIVSGTVVGRLDNDKVHIHDNKIEINDLTTVISDGAILNSGDHFSTNAFVSLSSDESRFNNNVIFGVSSDPRLIYDNVGRNVELNRTALKSIKSNGTVILAPVDTVANTNAALIMSGKAGGSHSIRYHNSYAALQFISDGSASHSSGSVYDFAFEGGGARTGKVSTLIDGNLTVANSIMSNKQKIEIRSVANSGWGFYAN